MWIRTEMVEYTHSPWKKVVQVIFPPVFTFAFQLLVDPQLATEKNGLPADGQGVLPHLLLRGKDLLLPGGHLATIHPEVDEIFESLDINVSEISDAFQVFFVASQSADKRMTPIHSVVIKCPPVRSEVRNSEVPHSCGKTSSSNLQLSPFLGFLHPLPSFFLCSVVLLEEVLGNQRQVCSLCPCVPEKTVTLKYWCWWFKYENPSTDVLYIINFLFHFTFS